MTDDLSTAGSGKLKTEVDTFEILKVGRTNMEFRSEEGDHFTFLGCRNHY